MGEGEGEREGNSEREKKEGGARKGVVCVCVCVCRDCEFVSSHPRPASHCQASHTLSALSHSPNPNSIACTASHLPARTAWGSRSRRICRSSFENSTLPCWTARP